MSTTNVRPIRDISGAYEYLVHGKGGKRKQHLADGANRIAFEIGDLKGQAFLDYCQACSSRNPRRKIQAFEIRDSFAQDEISPDDPETIRRAAEKSYLLARKAAPHSVIWVICHLDGEGGCVHTHTLVCNNDEESGKALSSGMRFSRIKKLNDELSAELGFDFMPTADKGSMWRDERIKHDGFERLLGDKVEEAKQASNSLDEFDDNLFRRGVERKVKTKTLEDGSTISSWTYYAWDHSGPKSRKRRRKANKLADDLTKKQVEQYFAEKQHQMQVGLQPSAPGYAAASAAAQAANEADIEALPAVAADDCQFFEQFALSETEVSEVADDLIAAKRREDMHAGRRIDTSAYQSAKANAKADTAKLQAELDAARAAFMQAKANREALKQSGGQFSALSKCFRTAAKSLMKQTRNPLACVALSFALRMADYAKHQRELERQRQTKLAAQKLYEARGNLWTAEKRAKAAGIAIAEVHSRPVNQRANALMEKGEQLEREYKSRLVRAKEMTL